MPDKNNHNYSIFKRISILIIVILAVVIIVNLNLMHTQNANQWYQVESEQLGRSLAQQAAKLVAGPMANNDTELLNRAIELVDDDKFIQDAVIYNAQGVRLDKQLNAFNMLEKQSDQNIIVFVEDIIHESKIIGYIKLVLDKQLITQHHQQFNQKQMQQTILVVVLASIFTLLLTRLFYKTREKLSFKDNEDMLL